MDKKELLSRQLKNKDKVIELQSMKINKLYAKVNTYEKAVKAFIKVLNDLNKKIREING